MMTAADALILHSPVGDGASQDEQDTLVQVDSVERALIQLGWATRRMPFEVESLSSLRRSRPGVVFNLVEDSEHMVPAARLLEELGVPFTGCSSEALRLTTDKLEAKTRLLRVGLPTPQWLTTREEKKEEAPASFILKPVSEDASVGIDESSVLLQVTPEAVLRELESRQQSTAMAWFAERYVEGREFNISVCEREAHPLVLPPAEIVFTNYPHEKPRIVGYRAKWASNSFEFHHTPRGFEFPAEDEKLLKTLRAVTERCWHLFGLSGYARVDFRVDAKGNPWILEVNANPGIAPDSGFVAA